MQSAESGPLGIYGNLDGIPSGVGSGPVPSPNADAGPSFFFQWAYLPDPRFIFPKDQVTGRMGVVVGQSDAPYLKSFGGVPAAVATNNIAAAQNVASGTAMTLAGGSTGITLNVPIIPLTSPGVLNGNAVATAAMALDFGFGFGSTTTGSGTVTVAAAALVNYQVGMPLVIGAVGNAGGTIPLLTQVTAVGATNTITVSPVPLATNATAPIGTGNLWSPTGATGSGQPLLPTAAYPFLAAGPALLLDSAQALGRGVQITGAAGSVGGTFTVSGWDVYGDSMTQLVTVGAASTAWSLKTFKYIASVTPNFTDAHNYSVGTSDVFGFNWAVGVYENTTMFWAGSLVTGSPNGFLASVATNPATNITGDVRGTFQASTNGGGTGQSATASNGSVSGLVMTGNRLELYSRPSLRQMIYSTQADNSRLYGPVQN